MKPKIYLYGTSGQYGNYLAALTEAGAEPVLSRDLFRACGCDGLLLPGGGDIGVTLEATDSFLIRSFADSGRPILGICRGMQALNVFFGGTLHARIPGHQQAQGDLIHPTRARGLLSQLLGPAPAAAKAVLWPAWGGSDPPAPADVRGCGRGACRRKRRSVPASPGRCPEWGGRCRQRTG